MQAIQCRAPSSGVPQVLIPFNKAEAITVAHAGTIADRGHETIRRWAQLHGIGRRVPSGSGPWRISRVALSMLMDGDHEALANYLAGDRTSPEITAYYQRHRVPLPISNSGAVE
jgi:hypothetical protein